MSKKKPEKYMLEVRIIKDQPVREAIGAISMHWSALELMVRNSADCSMAQRPLFARDREYPGVRRTTSMRDDGPQWHPQT